MNRITLSLEDEYVAILDERAAEDDSNRTHAARQILREYEQRRKKSHDAVGEDKKISHSEYDNLLQRVNDLEARVADLEASEPVDVETPPTPDESGRERAAAPPATVDAHVHEPAEEIVEDLRDWLADHPPKTQHGKQAVLAAVQYLREHGDTSTAEIQDAVYEPHSDDYASERTLWNSISRYLEDVPGVTKPEYGTWGWAGDEQARRDLAETQG